MGCRVDPSLLCKSRLRVCLVFNSCVNRHHKIHAIICLLHLLYFLFHPFRVICHLNNSALDKQLPTWSLSAFPGHVRAQVSVNTDGDVYLSLSCFKEFFWGSEWKYWIWRRLHFWRPRAEYRLLRLWSGLPSPGPRWLPASPTSRHGVSRIMRRSPQFFYANSDEPAAALVLQLLRDPRSRLYTRCSLSAREDLSEHK